MIELRQFIIPLRKWWWLLLVSTLLAAGTSTYVYDKQPPIYQARTVLMIGRTIEDPNPTSNLLTLGQQLAGVYANLAHQDLVRSATMRSLGMTNLPEYRASVIPNTQFIEIVVKSSNPEIAQRIANELANQLILQSPTTPDVEEQNRFEFVNKQLDILEVQISETQTEIEHFQNELGNMTSALQITDTKNQITALQAKLNTLQNNYASLLANTSGGAVNTITIIEPASLPLRPLNTNNYITIFLISLVVLALSACAAYLLEYIDDTIRSPEDISRFIGKPVLGSISEFPNDRKPGIFVENYPESPTADAFRLLNLNLQITVADFPPKTILITSTDKKEGKTTIAANLALTMTHSEKKVMLLDADLHKSSLQKMLAIKEAKGVSDFLLDKIVESNIVLVWKDSKLAIITSGSPVSNPAELLISREMDRFLGKLKQVANVVVIDGPPIPVVETSILASKVDGIILVIQPGLTNKSKVQAMIKQLERIGTPIIGVVLNRVTKKRVDFNIDYTYQESFYYTYRSLADRNNGLANGNGNNLSTRLRKLAESIPNKVSRKDKSQDL
jgi:capsular exopolysaccharide synthesis family protein